MYLEKLSNLCRQSKKIYYLMNKDVELAKFSIVGFDDFESCEIISSNNMPEWIDDLTTWVENRGAAKHREHIRKIFDVVGGITLSNIIALTHCLSLNDSIWVKSENELSLKWSDVNLYENDFDENISKLSFDGSGLYGIQMSTTSPELTTDGSYDKCWIRTNNDIQLIKAGSAGAKNAGLEPYCEVLASQVYEKMLPNHSVKYELHHYRDRVVSVCNLFTNTKFGYKPFAGVWTGKNKPSINKILDYYSSLGCEDSFRRMIVTDGVCLNSDRHFGNFGVMIDNDDYSIMGINPCFDFNMSFAPYAEEEIDFPIFNQYIRERGPVLGNYYASTAKAYLTPSIRADLINLKQLDLFVECDNKFNEERLRKMNDIKDTMIARILGEQRQFYFAKDEIV